MKICFSVLLTFLAVGCSVNNSSKTAAVQNGNTNVPHLISKASNKNSPVENLNLKTTVYRNENSKPLDCNDPNGYSLAVVTDPNRDPEKTGTVPKNLNIVVGDEIRTTIKVPTDSDAMNFSLNSTEKTKEGFEITVEYGSRYYFQKQFSFTCKEGNFYLYKIKVESFDKNDPKSMDKWNMKEIRIKPNLPIEKFSIFDYLAN